MTLRDAEFFALLGSAAFAFFVLAVAFVVWAAREWGT